MEADSDFSKRRIAAYRAAYRPKTFDRQTLTARRYVLAREGPYTVCYAPIGARPRTHDRLIFVGITPGFEQMQLAAKLFISLPPSKRHEGVAYSNALRVRVAFGGPMRTILFEMLETVRLPQAFGVDCAADLFSAECKEVATTSALVFPTFRNGKNLGRVRAGQHVKIFDDMLESQLIPRLNAAPDALIIALGSTAQVLVDRAILNHHTKNGKTIDGRRVLTGFPHPSGNNGHRHQQLGERRNSLRRQIRRYFA
jgi:hypothetical protein